MRTGERGRSDDLRLARTHSLHSFTVSTLHIDVNVLQATHRSRAACWCQYLTPRCLFTLGRCIDDPTTTRPTSRHRLCFAHPPYRAARHTNWRSPSTDHPRRRPACPPFRCERCRRRRRRCFVDRRRIKAGARSVVARLTDRKSTHAACVASPSRIPSPFLRRNRNPRPAFLRTLPLGTVRHPTPRR